jgi:hypothetical protein
MMWFFIFLTGVIVGIAVGRLYGWMKYHYPEFQEEIRVKTARKRLERISIEAEEERIRARIDASLDRRINA